jgi:hypothetical protein
MPLEALLAEIAMLFCNPNQGIPSQAGGCFGNKFGVAGNPIFRFGQTMPYPPIFRLKTIFLSVFRSVRYHRSRGGF